LYVSNFTAVFSPVSLLLFHPQLSLATSFRPASYRFFVAAVASLVLCLAADFIDGPVIFDSRVLQHERIHFRLIFPFLTSFSCLLLSTLLRV
jgi:hypothetical protein